MDRDKTQMATLEMEKEKVGNERLKRKLMQISLEKNYSALERLSRT